MKKFFIPLVCLFSLPVFGQNVHLNPGFGSAGFVITPNTSEINRIAIQSDGTIFGAGYSMQGGGSGIYHLTLTRNNSNGTPVSNFGMNGMVTTPIDHSEFPLDIQLQTDEKILVSGSSYLGPTQSGPGDYRSFVVRYLPDGNLDNNFADSGIFKLTHPDSHIAKMIVLADGSVLLAGNSYGAGTVSKIDQNGDLDPAFGSNGSTFLSEVNFAFILWDAILLTDNTILCVGYDMSEANNMKLAYCKVDLDGNFVSGFGQNGKMIMDLFSGGFPEVGEYLQKAIELPNGQIIIGGQTMGGMLMKINPDGSVVSNFGTNGILNHPYPFADFQVQADGKFLIGGSHQISQYNAGFSITRLNSNGSLDNSFNGTGTFTVDISSENDYLQDMKLTGNGHIFVGGSSSLLSNDSDFMLADIDIHQSLGLEEENLDGITVYPNPFSDKLHVLIESDEITEIRLMDETGRIVTQFIPESINTLYLDSLANGFYELILTYRSGNVSFKKLLKASISMK